MSELLVLEKRFLFTRNCVDQNNLKSAAERNLGAKKKYKGENINAAAKGLACTRHTCDSLWGKSSTHQSHEFHS